MSKYQGSLLLSHEEVADLIASVGHLRTVLVQGENGVGKSSVMDTLKAMPALKDHFFVPPVDCAQMDVGDHIIPAPDFENGVTRGLPNERYGVNARNQKGVNGSRPVVLNFDELGKAPKHVQASIAPVFYERRLGSFTLPEGSLLFGTTNLGMEGLGDFMPSHTRNRLIVVTMRKPTYEEWRDRFAIPRGLEAEVIAFGDKFPKVFDSFLDYEKEGKYAGKDQAKDNEYIYNPRVVQEAYASPRSLHAVSDIIASCRKLPMDVVGAAINGAVGVPTGEQLKSFVMFGRELPDFRQIVLDPEGTSIPTSPVAQIVQTFQLVTRTEDRSQAESVIKYVKRMRDEMQSLFCNTVAASNEKVSKFASITEFHAMLKANSIFFAGGQ